MEGVSVIGLILRFILGGGSVAAAFLLGRRIGGRFGGIFAAFPGVYLASVLSVGAGHSVAAGNRLVLQVSQGALLGMLVNILVCLAAGWLVPQKGYFKGLVFALIIWAVVGSAMITFVSI